MNPMIWVNGKRNILRKRDLDFFFLSVMDVEYKEKGQIKM